MLSQEGFLRSTKNFLDCEGQRELGSRGGIGVWNVSVWRSYCRHPGVDSALLLESLGWLDDRETGPLCHGAPVKVAVAIGRQADKHQTVAKSAELGSISSPPESSPKPRFPKKTLFAAAMCVCHHKCLDSVLPETEREKEPPEGHLLCTVRQGVCAGR